jgi:ABC-2 type transport system permease protein
MPIFDQGYQHWSGKIGGRARRWWAITSCGVRAGKKSWSLRIFMLFAAIPSLLLAGFLCIWSLLERKSAAIEGILPMLSFIYPQIIAAPRYYRVEVWTLAYNYFLLTQLYFSMIVILLVGPNLISQDLRFNALPLYFSRPLRRIDYFVGKLGIIVYFMSMVVIIPSIVAYLLGLATSLDITILRDTFGILVSSVFYGLIIAVSAGLLVLAMSSLTRNSRYVALLWIGIWLVSSITARALDSAQERQRNYAYNRQRYAELERRREMYRSGRQRDLPPLPALPPSMEETTLAQAKIDWRPLVSYTGDLSRVGAELLGTHACWNTVSNILPPQERQYLAIANSGDLYPWTWSAEVLGGLFVLSVGILNFRVKSLDRLR